MVSGAAIAGALAVNTRVNLQLPRGGTYRARVAACHGLTLELRLLDQVPGQVFTDDCVLDISMPLAWGTYKWLCIVSRDRDEWNARAQLLDGPVFSPRRSDPRVGVALPARVGFGSTDGLEEFHRAVVTDLSSWGLKLEVAKGPPSGAIIEVTVHLPGRASSAALVVSILGSVAMTRAVQPGGGPAQGGGPAHGQGGRPVQVHDIETAITEVHVSFLDGQEQALQAISRFVGEQLERRGMT
jgi:hypothetical protein